jgi:hypothetical protein
MEGVTGAQRALAKSLFLLPGFLLARETLFQAS